MHQKAFETQISERERGKERENTEREREKEEGHSFHEKSLKKVATS